MNIRSKITPIQQKPMKISLAVILSCMVFCCVSCGESEITRKFLTSLDDGAIITGQIRGFIELLADQGRVNDEKGIQILQDLDALDYTNKAILEESKKYLVVQPDGTKVLRITKDGKAQLNILIASFNAAVLKLSSRDDFDLSIEDRQRWTEITAALGQLALTSTKLFARIKPTAV